MAGFLTQGAGWITEGAGGASTSADLTDASALGGPSVEDSLDVADTRLDAVETGLWTVTSGQWTWDSSPKTALTINLAEREAFTLYVIVHLTTYRVATLSFQSSFVRMICNGRRPAGGSAAVSTAATLNAGTIATPTIAATASGNSVAVNAGTGLATNENQVVYYDVHYRLIRKTISY